MPNAKSGLAAWCIGHRRVVLTTTFILLIAAVASMPRLQLHTSNFDLVDKRRPAVADFLQAAQRFGNANGLVLVLEGDNPGELATAVDQLGPALRELKSVRVVVDRLPVRAEALEEAGMDGYFTTDDGRAYFVFIQPRDNDSALSAFEPFIADVREVMGTINSDIRMGLTGIPQYAMDDRDYVQSDITAATLVSLLLVALVFFWGFRSWRAPLAALLTLMWALLLTLGWAAWVPGYLTLLSALFATLLGGLGIDYAIHVLHRALVLQHAGHSPADSIIVALGELKRPLAQAALTTIAVFVLMGFSTFKGFAELGWLAAWGLALCWGSVYTLLPVLWVTMAGQQVQPALVEREHIPRGLAPIAILCIAASFFIGWPSLNDDYRQIQPKDSEALRLETLMVESSSYSPYVAILTADTAAQADHIALALLDEPTVGSVRTWADFSQSFDPADWLPAAHAMRRMFEDDAGHHAVYVYPAENIWDQAQRQAFLETLDSVVAPVTGMPLVSQAMLGWATQALLFTAIGGLVFMAAIGLVMQGSWRLALVTLIPPLGALSLTAAGMQLLGWSFNTLNMMAIPLILGIAVDDAVHLVEALRDKQKALGVPFRAVLLTTLTTLAAFCPLTISTHRGLQSFAVTLSLGVAGGLLCAAGLVPLLVSLGTRERRDDPI